MGLVGYLDALVIWVHDFAGAGGSVKRWLIGRSGGVIGRSVFGGPGDGRVRASKAAELAGSGSLGCIGERWAFCGRSGMKGAP